MHNKEKITLALEHVFPGPVFINAMMDNLSKAISLLRQTAVELENRAGNQSQTNATTTATMTATTVTPINSVAEVRRLFSPYQRPSHAGASGSGKWPRRKPMPKWSHKFCCLSDPSQDYLPNKDMKRRLHDAGLGERRIVLDKSSDPQSFVESMIQTYPKLKNAGGFEILRSANRYCLELIKPPTNGYSTEYLADSCSIGQSILFVRPLQKELDMNTAEDPEPSESCPKEKCLLCEEIFPVVKIKSHIAECHQEDDNLPQIQKKRRMVDNPICKYTCSSVEIENDVDSYLEKLSEKDCTDINMEECPICFKKYAKEDIEIHSSLCGVTDPYAKELSLEETFDEEISVLQRRRPEGNWKISIVRSKFVETSMDQLTEANEADWLKAIKVEFIGEEGIDHGGLSREFFSLLFSKSPIFEDNSLSLDPVLIENKMYEVIGKAVAVSLLHDFPGPRNLNKIVTDFILNERIPQFKDIDVSEVTRSDAKTLIQEITNATALTLSSINEEYLDYITMTGFSKKLTMDNKWEAITAIKGFYILYRIMTPILQFIEGLRFQNILALLRKYPEEGKKMLQISMCSAEELEKFFIPSYSTTKDEKSVEEIIVYNFNKFLKRVERGKVTTFWINPTSTETLENEEPVTLNCGHICQSFVGSSQLPRNINSGLIIFDHKSNNLSTVNTCAPSITFSNLQEIQLFEKFEKHLINIIVCAYGFGII